MGMFPTVNMVMGVIKSDWVNFLWGWKIVSWWGPAFLDVSLFLLKFLAVIHVCGCSVGVFLWVPFNVFTMVLWRDNSLVFHHFSFISYLAPLFLITHPRYFYFMCGIDDALNIWKDLGWYCWLVFICWCCWPVFLCYYCCLLLLCWYLWLVFFLVYWSLFVPLWCWNLFPKFLLKMCSIIEWDGFISMSDVSIFSDITYI